MAPITHTGISLLPNWDTFPVFLFPHLVLQRAHQGMEDNHSNLPINVYWDFDTNKFGF